MNEKRPLMEDYRIAYDLSITERVTNLFKKLMPNHEALERVGKKAYEDAVYFFGGLKEWFGGLEFAVEELRTKVLLLFPWFSGGKQENVKVYSSEEIPENLMSEILNKFCSECSGLVRERYSIPDFLPEKF